MQMGKNEKSVVQKDGIQTRKAWATPKLTAMPSELAETNLASQAIDRLYPAANGSS